MKLSEMCKGVGPWLASEGPHGDVVVSSRIRLARNVAGFHFYSHANPEQQKEILEFVHERLMRTPLKKDLWYISMSDTSAMERRLLTERHLISRELAEPDGSRAVALSRDESLVLMINEEDHLRIQIMAQGLQLMPIFTRICEIDDILESQLEYAFSAQLGYLTACPTNVGTGIRVSVMLHLPGLKMTNQIEKVFRAAKDMKLAVRGFHGEGSEPLGDLFQLSNQITLGKTEEEIIDALNRLAVKPILEYEKRAREKLLREKHQALDDKIFRALGILGHARLISTEEALYMLSYVRLGIYLKRIEGIDLATVNKLLLLIQPAHLQNLRQETLNSAQRDQARADLLREQLQQARDGR